MIYIFGDSFAYPGFFEWEIFKYKGWYQYFNTKVKNQAIFGSGPQYSFELLDKTISSLTSDDRIIFIISYPERFNFFSSEPQDSGKIFKFINYKKNPEKYVKNIFNSYIELHEQHINFLYLTFQQEIKYFNLRYLLHLKYLSDIKNIKIFAMGVPKMMFDVSHINNEKFYYLDDLETISAEEIIDYKMFMSTNNDKRKNHLSESNNKNLFNMINDFFENGILQMENYKKIFEKNVFYSSEVFIKSDYIYD